MSQKILVLNGSPRKNGNTSMLIDAFTEGAQSAGNSVTRFDLGTMNVHPCIGCLHGGKDKQSPCTQKDDMDKVYPVYREADVLVLASPLYFWGFTAQIKAALDRLFAVMEADGPGTAKKQCVLLIAAQENSEKNFALIKDYYAGILARLGWGDLGTVLAADVLQIGDIKGKPTLDEAKKLGASIG